MNIARRLVPLLLLALPGLALAHGPVRLKVEEGIKIAAPADKVWALVKDFCSISTWHPLVAKCDGKGGDKEGATRTLTLKAGGKIEEELVKYEDGKSYKYKITQGDLKVLPVSNYQSTLSVEATGSEATVKWKGAFYRGEPRNNPPKELNDEAATGAVTKIYKEGLANLKKLAEKK
jgi:hypothetical protein